MKALRGVSPFTRGQPNAFLGPSYNAESSKVSFDLFVLGALHDDPREREEDGSNVLDVYSRDFGNSSNEFPVQHPKSTHFDGAIEALPALRPDRIRALAGRYSVYEKPPVEPLGLPDGLQQPQEAAPAALPREP